MSTTIQTKPWTFEEAVKEKIWKDTMIEEKYSVMKNDVWEVVPRPKDKFVVTWKWIYKMKHRVDGRAEKYKARFLAHVSLKRKELTMMKYLHYLLATPLSDP